MNSAMFPRGSINAMAGSPFEQLQQFFPPVMPAPTMNYMHASLNSLSLLPGFQADPNIKVSLDNKSLWESFNKHTTEMIITKTGRRMFPVVKINVSGLEKNTRYYVILDMAPVDDCRYKYHSSSWTNSGKGDPHFHGRYYTHPDSPATGAQWMRQAISFGKVKLTNNNFDQNGQIILNSMHKYQPRIHIIRSDDLVAFNYTAFNTFSFLETTFVAVTAYQNEQITKLKIDNNPFAKGFRDLRDCKRIEERWNGKRTRESISSENEEPVKLKIARTSSEDDHSPSPRPDSTCSPALMNSCPSISPFSPANPLSSVWQQYNQNYMNYLYPQAANWMFQRFPVTSTSFANAAMPFPVGRSSPPNRRPDNSYV